MCVCVCLCFDDISKRMCVLCVFGLTFPSKFFSKFQFQSSHNGDHRLCVLAYCTTFGHLLSGQWRYHYPKDKRGGLLTITQWNFTHDSVVKAQVSGDPNKKIFEHSLFSESVECDQRLCSEVSWAFQGCDGTAATSQWLQSRLDLIHGRYSTSLVTGPHGLHLRVSGPHTLWKSTLDISGKRGASLLRRWSSQFCAK